MVRLLGCSAAPGTAGGPQSLQGLSEHSPDQGTVEACLVVSVLEPRVKRNLISWFVQLQLKEYSILFALGEDEAWLDRLDSRYNWLKKHLIEFEERFGPLFPPDWEMSERITAEFCRMTRTDLIKIIKSRQQEVDTKLLLHAIQKTAAFEGLLSRRLTRVTLNITRNIEQSIVQTNTTASQGGESEVSCGQLTLQTSTLVTDYFLWYENVSQILIG